MLKYASALFKLSSRQPRVAGSGYRSGSTMQPRCLTACRSHPSRTWPGLRAPRSVERPTVSLSAPSGQSTAEDEQEVRHKAAITELHEFVIRRLAVAATVRMQLKAIWIRHGSAARLKSGGRVFYLRLAREDKSCQLHVVEGEGDRAIARIDSGDEHFGSRVLASQCQVWATQARRR